MLEKQKTAIDGMIMCELKIRNGQSTFELWLQSTLMKYKSQSQSDSWLRLYSFLSAKQ